ncbi:hypothetical protein FSC12_03345 [Acinetobacter schindleri]|nr:hypothetical protein FSC12_03345 [Acinetobacter schindleri]
MHECQEIRSANINQKEDRFLIYERDLIYIKISLIFTQKYNFLLFISFIFFSEKNLRLSFVQFCLNFSTPLFFKLSVLHFKFYLFSNFNNNK